MPIHSRITSINSFSTAKTERVPIVSEYIEDYFNVKTNRPLDSTVPNKIETKGIDWTTAADGGTGEAEGLMWLKKLYETADHALYPKENSGLSIDLGGSPVVVGVGSMYVASNSDSGASEGFGNMSGYANDAGIKFEKDAFTIQRSSLINNMYTTGSTMDPLVYYSFKKKKKFFDIKVYEGNATAGRVINHNLDCEPGCVMIKCLSGTQNWVVYHKYGTGSDSDPSVAYKYYYALNSNAGANFMGAGVIQPVGTTHVTLNVDINQINASGQTYMIMFFADAGSGGFGDDGSLDGIACGAGTVGDWNSANSYQDLGFEPQWVLVKGYYASDSTQPWCIVDTQRNMYSDYESGSTFAKSPTLQANSNELQSYGMSLFTDGGGFYVRRNQGNYGTVLQDGDKYIYIAIPRPQRTATQQNMFLDGVGTGATNFFSPTTVTAGESRPTVLPGFSPDSAWIKTNWNSESNDWKVFHRKMGIKTGQGMSNAKQFKLMFNTHDNKDGGSDVNLFYGNGFYANSDGSYNYDANDIFYLLKKTPHFYDTQHTFLDGTEPKVVKHSLGKKPELMISKITWPSGAPSIGGHWWMYSSAPGLGYTMVSRLNQPEWFYSGDQWAADHAGVSDPTASTFTLGSISGSVSGSGWAHTMLFSSCPGVSKVGFYTGTGSLIDIDCEFASTPRFVQIQRTDTDTNHKRYIWDSFRGMSGFNGAGEQIYGSPGDYTWTAPAGVTSISIVLVGGGGGTPNSSSQSGGGGGALAWKNNITVIPGVSYNLTVGVGGSHGVSSGVGSHYNGTDGGNSTFTVGSDTYVAYGGKGAIYRSNGGSSYPSSPGDGGTRSANTDGGGDGGRGGWNGGSNAGGGGGGAGGYSGDGGGGGYQGTSQGNGTASGADGLGGGSGGGGAGIGGNALGAGGGGTGLYGEGASGTGGSAGGGDGDGGQGGSVSNSVTPPGPSNALGGGRNGPQNWSNGVESDAYFGGGGGSQGGGGDGMGGAKGGIRIVWGESVAGVARTFPASANTPYLLDPYLSWGELDQSTTSSNADVGITNTGFQVPASASMINSNGKKYIFLAIA